MKKLIKASRRIGNDFYLDENDKWKWIDFGNDIIRYAQKQGITLRDFDCDYDDVNALSIHFLVYVMNSYEFAIDVSIVGNQICIEQRNDEDDYLNRIVCDSLDEAYGQIANFLSNAVKFGKWTAVKSSKKVRRNHRINAAAFGHDPWER